MSVAAEILKLRTTRTPWVLLLVAAVLSAIAAAALVGSGSLADQEDRWLALAQGASFGTTLATVVGILLLANEYRHATITTTFLVEPRRERVLLSKLATSLLAGALFGVVVFVVACAVALPWAASRGEALELEGQAVEALARLVLAFALSAMLGTAVAAIIQSQVGAIVAVFVWFLIVESLIQVLSGLVFAGLGEPEPIGPYLPGSALGGIVGGQGGEYMLGASASTALAIAYVVGLAALGALAMTRRDP